MPIYEFYCDDCNTVFNFFSRSVNTKAEPVCPRCQGTLKRQMSIFSKVTRGKEEASGDDMPQFDEARMEKAMTMLAGEADRIDENDPRQAAQLMRKLSEAAGISFGDGMEDALNRLERGDDPEQIEEEMGSLLETEEPVLLNKKGAGKKRAATVVDETLYEL
jgi:putative FmdB family regulatory protein